MTLPRVSAEPRRTPRSLPPIDSERLMEPINIGKHFPQVYIAYHAASNEAEAAALGAGETP